MPARVATEVALEFMSLLRNPRANPTAGDQREFWAWLRWLRGAWHDRTRMAPRFLRLSLYGAALLLLPTLADAWTQDQQFGARVHKHEFSRVLITGEGCTVKVRLFFDAPAEAYESETASRNYYRFHARIKLDSEHVLLTGVFHNQTPGAHLFDYQEDTTASGCWAKSESHPRAVDVEGCRGRGCTPAPFK